MNEITPLTYVCLTFFVISFISYCIFWGLAFCINVGRPLKSKHTNGILISLIFMLITFIGIILL